MVRKGDIACYKRFLLFSQCFPHLYISLVCQSVPLCGNRLMFGISYNGVVRYLTAFEFFCISERAVLFS